MNQDQRQPPRREGYGGPRTSSDGDRVQPDASDTPVASPASSREGAPSAAASGQGSSGGPVATTGTPAPALYDPADVPTVAPPNGERRAWPDPAHPPD